MLIAWVLSWRGWMKGYANVDILWKHLVFSSVLILQLRDFWHIFTSNLHREEQKLSSNTCRVQNNCYQTNMFRPEAFTQVMQLVLNPPYNLSLQANFIIIWVSGWSQNTSTSAWILIRDKLQANKLRWQFPTQTTVSWAAMANTNSNTCYLDVRVSV